MEERKVELLEVPYFHVVFTLPAEIEAIAYQNKAVIHDLLFKAASDKTMALEPGEFIRRFLMHVLPKGFHRIRH